LFDALQQDALPLDSLLAAIARFSLQTSARNQLFGTALAVSRQGGTAAAFAAGRARHQRLISQLVHLIDRQQKAFDALQQDALPLDSLLAAIARFSLQTSARNPGDGGQQAVERQSVLLQRIKRFLLDLLHQVKQLNPSARNQLFGTVISNDSQPVLQHLQVLLADGVTQLKDGGQQAVERQSVLLQRIKRFLLDLLHQVKQLNQSLQKRLGCDQ
jgi:molybdenum-dependent DNA-binding transcriptional regulator ModE